MTIAPGHLALFLPSLAGGGAERVFITLANGFAERGLVVDLVVAGARGVFREKVNPRVNLVDLRAGRVLAALPALAAYLRRAKPNALISGLAHANLVAIWARMLTGVPTKLVLTEHNTLRSLDEAGVNRRERVVRPLLRMFYPRADVLVGVSSGVADELATATNFPRTRTRVIYNPIVTPELTRLAQADPTHPWLREEGAPVLLSVGRLAAAKDFETLLRAFALVRAAQPCRLLILGEGPERARLEGLADTLGIRADVALPGFDSNPYAAMRCAAVFVSSSLHEGLASVIVEALACGAPVVATDCPHGTAEILGSGRYGRLTPVGDAPALADAIFATLREPPDPAAGLRRAQDFSLDSALDGYRSLLAELGV